MQIQRKTLNVQVDPLNYFAEIQILNGNTVQSLNKETDTFEPDREFDPLILMPYVSVHDTNGIMQGSVSVTNVEWYEGLPETGKYIAGGEGYEISANGTPANSLKVTKNIDPGKAIEITCRFKFTDTRLNENITLDRSVTLHTTYYEAENYRVKLDQPGRLFVDPTRCNKNTSREWPLTLNAQLFCGAEEVPDTEAVYWWYIKENNEFRFIDPEEDLFMLTSINPDGSFPKSITIDARFISTLRIKVRAAYYQGETAPQIPQFEVLQDAITIKVKLPQSMTGTMDVIKGHYIAPNKNQEIEAKCILYDNKRIVENPTQYYDITWYSKSQKPGSTAKVIAYGETLKTTSSQIGVTNTEGYEIWPDPQEKGVFLPLADDGVLLVDDDKLLITQ